MNLTVNRISQLPTPDGFRQLDFDAKTSGAVIIGGDFQGLGVLTSLAKQGIPIYLLDRGLCIGRFSRYVKRFSTCPDVRQEALFLKYITELAIKEELMGWVIYPNDDDTVRFLSRYRDQLAPYYHVTTPAWDVVRLAYDKKLTYELAARCGVVTPKTVYPRDADDLRQEEITFPAIIKPLTKEPFYRLLRKKAIRVNNRTDLIREYQNVVSKLGRTDTEIMIQDLIPGGAENLFSVGSLFKNSDFLARVVVRRPRQHPMDFGHATTYAETVDIPELEALTRRILTAMNYRGLSEVEFMYDERDRQFKLIEINARPWGWHTLAIAAGVDLPYLSFLEAWNMETRTDDFAKQVKWIRLTTDVPTVIGEILKGRMNIKKYLASLRGKRVFAVLSTRDLLPFMMEIVLLPYLFWKRGF